MDLPHHVTLSLTTTVTKEDALVDTLTPCIAALRLELPSHLTHPRHKAGMKSPKMSPTLVVVVHLGNSSISLPIEPTHMDSRMLQVHRDPATEDMSRIIRNGHRPTLLHQDHTLEVDQPGNLNQTDRVNPMMAADTLPVNLEIPLKGLIQSVTIGIFVWRMPQHLLPIHAEITGILQMVGHLMAIDHHHRLVKDIVGHRLLLSVRLQGNNSRRCHHNSRDLLSLRK